MAEMTSEYNCMVKDLPNSEEIITQYGNCSGTHQEMEDLDAQSGSYSIAKYNYFFDSEPNESLCDIVLARMKLFNKQQIDQKSKICRHHLKSLGTEWKTRSICCAFVENHNNRQCKVERKGIPLFSRRQSEALLAEKNIWIPTGSRVCFHCHKVVTGLVEKVESEKQEDLEVGTTTIILNVNIIYSIVLMNL